MYTKEDYYSAYLALRIMHFNAAECGAFEDYPTHFQAVQAVNAMRGELPAADRADVEAEIDGIFNTDGLSDVA